MTKEALKLALEALEAAYARLVTKCEQNLVTYNGVDVDTLTLSQEAITAIKEALAQQNQFNPDWDVMAVMVEEQQRMAKRIAELEAQPEQPKYRRGNRLVCLETDEYCVIHISGTDRQWVKFPDSHIGVYTNEQVAELFELLPKESEPWEKFCDSNCVWTDHHPDCKLAQPEQEQLMSDQINYGMSVTQGGKRIDPMSIYKEPEQEPVAAECKFDTETSWGRCSIEHHNLVQSEPMKWPQYQTRLLYTTPPPVAEPHKRKPLTDEELKPLMQKALVYYGYNPDNWYLSSGAGFFAFARAIEAAHGIKGEA